MPGFSREPGRHRTVATESYRAPKSAAHRILGDHSRSNTKSWLHGKQKEAHNFLEPQERNKPWALNTSALDRGPGAHLIQTPSFYRWGVRGPLCHQGHPARGGQPAPGQHPYAASRNDGLSGPRGGCRGARGKPSGPGENLRADRGPSARRRTHRRCRRGSGSPPCCPRSRWPSTSRTRMGRSAVGYGIGLVLKACGGVPRVRLDSSHTFHLHPIRLCPPHAARLWNSRGGAPGWRGGSRLSPGTQGPGSGAG